MKDSDVRLSDQELRQLQSITRALATEDPVFARRLRWPGRPWRLRLWTARGRTSLTCAIGAFAAGTALMIAALTVSVLVAGVGYLMMTGAALLACRTDAVIAAARRVRAFGRAARGQSPSSS
jgi:hypothetical protein